MFDSLKTILYGFTGRLKDEPTLRKYFWAFCAALAFTLMILGYNAFMSRSYYQKLLERFAGFDGELLATVVTIGVAVVVFFLIQGFTGTVLDYIGRRTEKTQGHEPMFLATVFALACLLALDIYANLEGVDYVAERTTRPVVVDQSTGEFERVQTRIEGKEEQLANLLAGKLGGYGWRDPRTKIYHLNNSGKRFQRSISSDIDQMRAQQKELVAAARSQHTRDLSRFQGDVSAKRVGHKQLVWFAYGVAFLLSIFTGHYTDKAFIHVYGVEFNPVGSGHRNPIGYQYNGPPLGNMTADKDRLNELTAQIKRLEKELRKHQKEETQPPENSHTGNGSNGKAFAQSVPPQSSYNGPTRNGKRIDGWESRNIIKATYLSLEKQGEAPTYKAISALTGISSRTVGTHVREMKREGVL